MSRRQLIACLAALTVLAFGLRVGAIIVLQAWLSPSAMEHRQLAVNLLEYGGFYFRDFGYFGPSSVQSPPYPVLLAGLFWLFGPETPAAYIAAMVINALLGAAVVPLTYWLARTLHGSATVALLAAAGVAVWPTQIYAATYVQAVVLITACVTAILILWERSVRSGRLAPWIGFSLIGTFAALTEPVLLPPMALAGLLIFAMRSLPFEIRLRNAAVLFAAAVLVIGPWSLRNRIVHGQWVPIKATFWVNMWKANNPYATGTDRLPLPEDLQQQLRRGLPEHQRRQSDYDAARQYEILTPEQIDRLEKQPEAVREAVFKEFTTTWISENPREYARLCLVRLGKTLWIDPDNPKTHDWRYIVPRAVLQTLTVIGLVIALRRRWPLMFAGVVVGLALLTYTLTITAARFSIPFEPLQLALAALVIAPLVDWVAARWRASGEAPAPHVEVVIRES
jgi:4-amino-4-deoxy-L-arabinose transferase-like glycosyltransferase